MRKPGNNPPDNTGNGNYRDTVVIVVNEDKFFVSHRFAIGEALLEAGWRVVVAGAPGNKVGVITEAGMIFEPLPVAPAAGTPAEMLHLVKALRRVYARYPGAIIHHVGMRQILFGNMAVAMSGARRMVVDAVSGLGILFMNPKSLKARITLGILKGLYKKGRNPRTIIFQNREDEKLFNKSGLLNDKTHINCVLIKGSGVDLEKIRPVAPPAEGRHVVLFMGRLLRSKGVGDLIMAAEMLREEFEGSVEFHICGGLSGNKDSMTEREMEYYKVERRESREESRESRVEGKLGGGYIQWLGEREDIARELARCCIVALPSYYREGVPLSLIEACAAGRAIVTCDSVGCRDTVTHGENGFLVEPRNPAQLARCLRELLNDESLCKRMGEASRLRAEREFSLRDVVKAHLDIYQRLING